MNGGEEKAIPGFVMVDDNPLVAAAMERRFATSDRVRWLGWSGESADAAMEMVMLRAPDVVLLDVDMPGVDTFELLKRLVAEQSHAAVLMFSGYDRPALVDRALQEGAAGYIHKEESTEIIAELMVRAARGECVLSPLVSRMYMTGEPGENA